MYADKQELIELMQDISSKINVPTIGIGGGYAPLGTINFFDATVAPQDWLACDGSVYNIADYPQLAEWYATQHGASNFYGGNGTTTFAVPDLQGEFLRGTGTNSHTNQGSGAALGVHQDGTLIDSFSYGSNEFIQSNRNASLSQNPDYQNQKTSIVWTTNVSRDTTQSQGGPYTTRPTNTSFLICVKAVVAGEVYSTEERVVGTWIDGKKIYQKTVQINGSFGEPDWHTAYIAAGRNIKKISSCYVYNTNLISIPVATKFISSSNEVQIYYSGMGSLSVDLMTIRYTKTTDG